MLEDLTLFRACNVISPKCIKSVTVRGVNVILHSHVCIGMCAEGDTVKV